MYLTSFTIQLGQRVMNIQNGIIGMKNLNKWDTTRITKKKYLYGYSFRIGKEVTNGYFTLFASVSNYSFAFGFRNFRPKPNFASCEKRWINSVLYDAITNAQNVAVVINS